MSDPFIAEIRMFGFTFAPYGWAACNGQLVPVQQNTALFALIGTAFGGDGRTTFGLPNFQGAVPVGVGDGPGLTPRSMGEEGGETQLSLLTSEMPAHNHPAVVGRTPLGTASAPAANLLPTAENSTQVSCYDLVSTAPLNTTMSPYMLFPQGGGQPHENRQPYLAVGFCMALRGVFPQFQ